MYWQNTQYLCTPALGLAAAAQHKDIFEVRGVWRYDKAEWNLLVFPHMTLCARVWRCVCPAGPYTCPALLQECHVSAMRQCSTNELWWERLGSAVGTLLPSLLSVPGNRSASGRGRPAARSSFPQWTPNKTSRHQVSYTSQCWVFSGLFFTPLTSTPLVASFTAGTLLWVKDWKKKNGHTQKQNSPSVGTFCLFIFSLSQSFYQHYLCLHRYLCTCGPGLVYLTLILLV